MGNHILLKFLEYLLLINILMIQLHEIKRQTTDFLLVNVSYTWSLNGHKKPVEKIDRSFYKENVKWKILT